MKELVIISGKGGTGKTSIVGSFAALAEDAILADCDVDASDLHLLLQPVIKDRHDFLGMKKALIAQALCTQCGICESNCRFDAIQGFRVDPFSCEGCGVCYHLCPQQAIQMVDNVCGQWFSAVTPYGPLIYARLGIGEENSGKLVAEVKKQTKELAQSLSKELIIIDGPPGIGCPVIATIAGVDLVLVITEPTVAGLHDLVRVLQLANHFQVPAAVCINKWDLDEEKSEEIEAYCREQKVEVIGRIPFDRRMTEAIIQGIPPVKYGSGGAMEAIQRVWQKVQNHLQA
ncbi:MAG: 4Fe-4S binding protein [Clostridia bacterium]|nr:4Fe-4S binding protein [Clostridia bacterium]